MIASTGSVTSSAPGTAIVLAANGNFINSAGSSAVSATNGAWQIYSQANGNPAAGPTGDVYGGLLAESYYGDAFAFGAGSPGSFATAPNAGNRFVYGYQPTLTITPANQSVTYNGQLQTDTYGVTGLQNGDAIINALQGTVTGLTAIAKDAGAYNLTASGTLTSDENYAITLGSGTLTITPKALTAALTGSITKTYDGTTIATLTSANYGSLIGVVSGDTVGLNNPTGGTYAQKDVGSSLGVTVTGLALTGAQASDYSLSST